MDHGSEMLDRKQQLRAQAMANRQRQENKDELSHAIGQRLLTLPEFAAAQTVLFYINVRAEVSTRPLLPVAWQQGKRVVVPYCVRGQLELFRLENFEELGSSTFGLLEPRAELRGRPDRSVAPSELDLVVVPGVAFDRNGGRLGHGRGYFDGLLKHVRSDTSLVALAFECQIVPEVPMFAHDIYMHKVVTEKAIYERRSRRPESP